VKHGDGDDVGGDGVGSDGDGDNDGDGASDAITVATRAQNRVAACISAQ
jgi:hypothetical protein